MQLCAQHGRGVEEAAARTLPKAAQKRVNIQGGLITSSCFLKHRVTDSNRVTKGKWRPDTRAVKVSVELRRSLQGDIMRYRAVNGYSGSSVLGGHDYLDTCGHLHRTRDRAEQCCGKTYAHNVGMVDEVWEQWELDAMAALPVGDE